MARTDPSSDIAKVKLVKLPACINFTREKREEEEQMGLEMDGSRTGDMSQ